MVSLQHQSTPTWRIANWHPCRYPFHLRPKSSQLAHCMRMAADVVHDLGLDEDFLTSEPWEQDATDEELDKIRAYLAFVYIVTT